MQETPRATWSRPLYGWKESHYWLLILLKLFKVEKQDLDHSKSLTHLTNPHKMKSFLYFEITVLEIV